METAAPVSEVVRDVVVDGDQATEDAEGAEAGEEPEGRPPCFPAGKVSKVSVDSEGEDELGELHENTADRVTERGADRRACGKSGECDGADRGGREAVRQDAELWRNCKCQYACRMIISV